MTERRRPHRFDPGQRSRDFTRERRRKGRKRRTSDRRIEALETWSFLTTSVASQPPGNSLIEIVNALPEPSYLDIGRQVIVRRGAGLPDKIYIGVQLPDDSLIWYELATLGIDEARAWIRHIASNGCRHATSPTDGSVVVTSAADHVLRQYTSGGTLVRTMGMFSNSSSASGGMNTPIGIHWWRSTGLSPNFDTVYVLRSATPRGVSEFYVTSSSAGINRASYDKTSGSADGQLSAAEGIWVVPSLDALWIADTGNHRVQKFELSGVGLPFDSKFGASGAGNGQFSSPRGVLVMPGASAIYVADTGNNRIQKFNGSGTYQAQWGSAGSALGQFSGPRQMALDAGGNIHVVDTGNDRVQIFSPDGDSLGFYGSTGSGEGQLSAPQGIAIASNGTVYVCDTGNNRISVWL